MKNISKFALTTLIIQTVLTMGLNWFFFIVYYRLKKYSFLSTNEEYYDISHIDLFFKKKMNRLSIISIVLYILYLFLLSFSIILVNNIDFFNIINFHLYSFFKSNVIYSILLTISIFFFLTYSYKILIKNVFNTIYKKNHVYFNNFSDLDLVSFIIISVLTLGWFYLLYLLTLGLYELYIYLINRTVNKTKYYFSTFGIISLFLIAFTIILLVYYLISFHSYLNFFSIYIMILFMSNTVLNYGMFELMMRLFLDDKLDVMQKKQDIIFKPYINKKIIFLCSIIIFISIIYSFKQINDIKEVPANIYDNISLSNLNCDTYGQNKVCTNQNVIPRFRLWNTPISPDDNFIYHQTLMVSVIYPSEIKNEAIKIEYGENDFYYTTPVGQFYSYGNNYLYVQTYYKRDMNNYVPVFNIIKNLELVADFTDFDILFSILDNNVYIYDFIGDNLSEYNRNYSNIDSTRLMIDDINITINSDDDNLYGYHLKNETADLHIKSDNNENLKYIVSYFDPFSFNELVFYLNNTFIPLSKEKLEQRTDIQLITFRVFKNTKHISYYNDRFYIYMDNIDVINQNIDQSYINSNDDKLIKCFDKICEQSTTKVLTNKISVQNLNKQSEIFYTDNYDTDFPIYDYKIISLYVDGNNRFYGEIIFNFDIKTIKQYFNDEKITNQTLTILE